MFNVAVWGKADDSNMIVPSVARKPCDDEEERVILPRVHALDVGRYSTSFHKLLRVDDDLSIPRVTICELHATVQH